MDIETLSLVKKMPGTAVSESIAAAERAETAAESAAETLESIPEDYSELSGDVTDLKENLEQFLLPSFSIDDFTTEGYIQVNGSIAETTTYVSTDYIPLVYGDLYCFPSYDLRVFSETKIGFYDKNKNCITTISPSSSSSLEIIRDTIPYIEKAYYVRFCTRSTYADARIVFGAITSKVNLNIDTKNIKNHAVTTEKTSFVIHDSNTSYIPNFISGKYIKANGEEGISSGLTATGWIELEENTDYYWEYLIEGYYAFYDENKDYIIGYPNNTPLANPFRIPTGAKYARFTIGSNPISMTNYPWIFTSDNKPDLYELYLADYIKLGKEKYSHCNYEGREFSTFNKCLCIGDSLTEGVFNHKDSGATQYETYNKYSYPTFLEKLSGVTVTNAGEASATADEWYSHHSNNDYSGYDVAIIQLGVNDVIRYTTFGSTTQQALENIFSMLQTANNKIKIFVANIIPATSYMDAEYKTFSDSLLAWLETKNQNNANIIPLDMNQYAHTAESSAYNCGHLSAFGYNRLAQDYLSYISWYMSTNKTLFKEVQFIGTNYWFDNPNE